MSKVLILQSYVLIQSLELVTKVASGFIFQTLTKFIDPRKILFNCMRYTCYKSTILDAVQWTKITRRIQATHLTQYDHCSCVLMNCSKS